jgi:hypothetical protein
MRDRDVVAVLQQMPGICFQSCERKSAEEWVHIYAWILVMNPKGVEWDIYTHALLW